MRLDARCARCGRPKYSDEQIALIEAEIEELLQPERPLYLLMPSRDEVCWDCMSLVEQRTENFQCARCGADGYDEQTGEEHLDGWITPHFTAPELDGLGFLCPDCQTDEEARADAAEFVAHVEQGRRLHAERGESFPERLAELAENQERWLRARERETDALNRALDEEA